MPEPARTELLGVIVPNKTVVCPAILAIANIPNRVSKNFSKNNKNPVKQGKTCFQTGFSKLFLKRKEPGETNFLGPFRVKIQGQWACFCWDKLMVSKDNSFLFIYYSTIFSY